MSNSSVLSFFRSADELSVPGYWLLALYGVVPVILLLVLADQLFLDAYLQQQSLPRFPEHWAFWAIVFNTPHIVASYFSFLDKDYIRHYQRQLPVTALFVVMLLVAVPALLGWNAFMLAFALATMYHVLAQQFGIARSLARIPLTAIDPKRVNQWFWCWKLSGTIGASLVYLWLFSNNVLIDAFGEKVGLRLVAALSSFFLLIATLVGLWLMRLSQSARGRWYIVANLLMLWSCLVLLLLDYPVFVVVIPRVIHDISAFMVYGVHDSNRARQTGNRHPLYRLSNMLGVPVFLACPLWAISLSYLFLHGDAQHIVLINYGLAVGHYVLESLIWKKGALHRDYVRFA